MPETIEEMEMFSDLPQKIKQAVWDSDCPLDIYDVYQAWQFNKDNPDHLVRELREFSFHYYLQVWLNNGYFIEPYVTPRG